MPQHFLDLPGANILPTPTFQFVDRDVLDLANHYALGAVVGQAGLGKTFAVQAALEHLKQDLAGSAERLHIAEVVFPHDPNPFRVALILARTLLHTHIPDSRTRYQLHDDIIERLLSTPHLLVVDEAQRLSLHAMDVLRSLYDDTRTRLAILFVGGNGCWETISREPMLKSRIFRRRQFRPLPADEVPDLMRAYHQLYVDADPNLLASIDGSYAHGNWRSWVNFTLTALEQATAAGRETLDKEITENVFSILGRS